MSEQPTRRIRISGSGYYLPDKILTNADLEKMVDTSDEWIVTRTGIRERHVLDPEQATSDLGIEAARKALKSARLDIKDIDLILVGTNTPDTIFPSTACWIQSGLKAPQVPAFDLQAGCTGFLYGMILAESLILSGRAKRILLVGADALTRITNWEDRSTCVLFGDGAGAFILEESHDESGMLSHYWGADGSLGELLMQPAGGSRLPATAQTVADKLHYLQMKGNEVFKHAVKRMGDAAEQALKRAGLKKEDVSFLIAHQANIRIIDATARKLGIPRDKVIVTVDHHGNTSAASVPLALDEAVRDGRIQRGQKVVVEGVGGGFTWGAALLEF